jgi:hypothetical protein
MTSRRTTHELAKLLEEIAGALRDMPDMPLSELQPRRSKKAKPGIDVVDLATKLAQLSKEEAVSRLTELSQRQLVQICKELKVSVGSKKTRESLIRQIVWQLFEAKDDLERIRAYEEVPVQS